MTTKPRRPPRGDRRVQRSRALLHQALVALILERGWDQVRVQDVCARARVGRSTFYVHFADKEDLLIGGLDDVRDALRRRCPPGKPPLGFLRGLMAHADESRRMFRAVIGKKSGLAVQRRFRQVVLELIAEELEALGHAEPQRQLGARYLAGALVEILIWWVDGRRSMSASEVEAAFLELSAPILRGR